MQPPFHIATWPATTQGGVKPSNRRHQQMAERNLTPGEPLSMPPTTEPALPRWSPPPIVAPFPRASRSIHSPCAAPKIRPVANHPSQRSAGATQICQWTWKVPQLAPSQRPWGGIQTVPSSHQPKGSSSSPTARGNRPLWQLVNVGAHTAAQGRTFLGHC